MNAKSKKRKELNLSSEEILSFVRKAIKNEEVEMYLQPIVSIPQQKTRFFECYSRIRIDDDISLIPQDFMSVAEIAAIMPEIDSAILLHTLEILRRIKKRQFNSAFFINVAESSLLNRFFIEIISEAIDDDKEILNSVFFDISAEAYKLITQSDQKLIEKLIHQGVTFCLDQPDNPAWNIEELNKYGVSYIKIPCQTLRDAVKMIGLEKFLAAKSLLDKNRIDLIATKIETKKDLESMLPINPDYGQGHFFGIPKLFPALPIGTNKVES